MEMGESLAWKLLWEIAVTEVPSTEGGGKATKEGK